MTMLGRRRFRSIAATVILALLVCLLAIESGCSGSQDQRVEEVSTNPDARQAELLFLEADFPLPALVDMCDTILVGDVSAIGGDADYTYIDVSVGEYIKVAGSPEASITVRIAVEVHHPSFAVGENVLLFLTNAMGYFELVTWGQGKSAADPDLIAQTQYIVATTLYE